MTSGYLEFVYGERTPSDFQDHLGLYIMKNYFTNVNGELLDLGCGLGDYVKTFSQLGMKKVMGLDKKGLYDSELILKPKSGRDYRNDPITFERGFDVGNSKMDYIFCKSVIEHIHNYEKFLDDIKRALKPGGKALLLTPAWEYNQKWFYEDPTHVKPYHRKGLQDALRIAGFKDVKVKYFYYLPQLWDKPWLLPVVKALSLLPDRMRWKTEKEVNMNTVIRFSKEVQLIAEATK